MISARGITQSFLRTSRHIRPVPTLPTLPLTRPARTYSAKSSKEDAWLWQTGDPYALDIPTVELAYDKYSPENVSGKPLGTPIVMVHGLFGSKTNSRTVSQQLSRRLSRHVYCVDLRNHGDSPHVPRHDYPALAADLEQFIRSVVQRDIREELGDEVEESEAPAIAIGHSMGAKTVMAAALRQPKLVKYVISVDNAPIDAVLSSKFPQYLRVMKQIEKAGIRSSKEAYKMLAAVEPNLAVQQFILTNLKRVKKSDGSSGMDFRFRIPLDTLAKSLDHIAAFPFQASKSKFRGPSCFMRGIQSHYVSDEAFPVIGSFFPAFEVRDFDCGHWVMSEKPQEFVDATVDFIERHEDV